MTLTEAGPESMIYQTLGKAIQTAAAAVTSHVPYVQA
jgi:hypothetical protein